MTAIRITTADQLHPGVRVRDRQYPEIEQTIVEVSERLIRFEDRTQTTIRAALRYLEILPA